MLVYMFGCPKSAVVKLSFLVRWCGGTI